MPKLNLRDLFWLVLVVAMGCGWWIEHREFASFRAARKTASPKANGGLWGSRPPPSPFLKLQAQTTNSK